MANRTSYTNEEKQQEDYKLDDLEKSSIKLKGDLSG